MKKYDTDDLVADLEVAFWPIRGSGARVAGFTELITKSLRGYSSETIKAAGEHLIQSRKAKTFPALAEIITACAAEHRLYAASSQSVSVQAPPVDSVAEHIFRTEKFQDLVNDRDKTLVKAASEDWIGGAHSYFMRTGRLPRNENEMDACRRVEQEFQTCYEDCVRKGSRFERLGASVRDKSEKLRSLLLREKSDRVSFPQPDSQ